MMLQGHAAHEMKKEVYPLIIYKYPDDGGYLARCEQLPTLFVFGKTLAEIRKRAPAAARHLLEQAEKHVEEVTVQPPEPEMPAQLECYTINLIATFDEAA